MTWSAALASLAAVAVVAGPAVAAAVREGRAETRHPAVASSADVSAAHPDVRRAESSGRWAWPLSPRPEVRAPFDAPESRWGPGHRGLDLTAVVGQEVRAVADGVVTHRGRVAGRGTVSVTHPDGLRSTYEPVVSDLAKGDSVRRGQLIGRVSEDPGHCLPATCLHIGALRGRDYLDPRPLFGGTRVILLPVPRD